ncbi:suppressor of fused domain protein [Actinomadura hibisca]|uniref:suppressor of fused domain protein n=1 Tax=Actinomadura hibisca TaxID=68565 RepID=UPI000836BE5A|nr:suppressor of fused domain protein [Actinomadura hibisca]
MTSHTSAPGGERDYRAIDRHLRDFFPDGHFHDFSWTKGPIQEVLPDFRVRRMSPASPDPEDAWVYVTMGAFEGDRGPRLEFVIEAPAEDPIHVESLAMVAHRHVTGTPLDLGQTVDIGRPWIDGSPQDCFMVDLPHSFGPKLEQGRLADGEPVRFLWLVPITRSEAEYARAHSADALGDLLEQKEADILDPFRPPVT